jgi:hypothetical protein
MIVGTTIIHTEQFKNYLINYFEKKEKMRLYRIFHKEYNEQKYSRRRFIENQQ